MKYTHRLLLSMVIPTLMVAGAGATVAVGATWLETQARAASATAVADQLVLGRTIISLLTMLCVATCIGFTVWIRRSAREELGGEPELARSMLATMAEGNLTLQVPPAPAGSVLHSVGRLVGALRAALGDISTAAGSINVASTEIAHGNADLSQRTEQAASNLQTTASSMVQLTGTVRQSADSARQANQLALSATEVAARGGAVVSQVVSTMDEISASSTKIADIIGVIDGIAFQTNILALNAAVEAARAGEQGRGFAVVAGEVRSLAQRSAEAAREIKALIGTSVDKVETGSKLVQDAGSTMSEIVASVQRVSAIIGEITAAAAEQSTGIGQVSSSVNQLDRMTQQNAALVEQSAAAAESLKEQAHKLAGVVGSFRLSAAAAA